MSAVDAVAVQDAAPTRPARWPWVVLAGFFALAIVALVLVSVNGESVSNQVLPTLAFTMFGVVGALIASRDRGNVIGLMLLFAAVVTASSFFMGEYFTWRVQGGHDGADVVLAGFLNNFGWLYGVLPVLFLLPLLFPDGHLPSRRWRPFVWFVVALLVAISIGFVFGQARLTGSSPDPTVSVPNPFYSHAVGRIPGFDPLIAVLFPGLFGLGIASLILRFRRSSGLVRQQIRWVVYGLILSLVGILLSYPFSTGLLNSILTGVAFLAFPVSIGISILRFRLYDLDVVIRKTVVYAVLALFATAVYVGLVVVLGAWLGSGNSFLTMVAAVVVAVSFQPVRARVARVADRLVYGRRATPYEVLAEFGERVGETYAADDVLPRMARVLSEAVGADRATVWLRVADEMRPVARWGEAGPERSDDHRVEVEHRGEVLGALSVAMPANDPIDPARERLVADLAAQAGLVLSNVRLTEELRARLDDLKAAQKRLVAAQDQERRRLERNIHDGAQQQLVALGVKLRLAQGLATKDGARTAEILEQLQAETQQALEDLRDLARGIYPPLLADRGLVAALEAQARKAPFPVEISGDGTRRYRQEVEAAVYFSVLECLQNVGKYAGASHARVGLSDDGAALAFEVADDGAGFDPASTGYGSGIQGMADRLSALDGTVEIRSAAGRGTTVRGVIPVLAGVVVV
jgi:signal transduction histidine kinase